MLVMLHAFARYFLLLLELSFDFIMLLAPLQILLDDRHFGSVERAVARYSPLFFVSQLLGLLVGHGCLPQHYSQRERYQDEGGKNFNHLYK